MTQPVEAPKPRGPIATAAITSGAFVALLWAIEIIDAITRGALEQFGVRPLNVEGLRGVLFAPLLHDDWGHLLANTGPLLVLGFIMLLSGVKPWLQATGIIWLVSGVGTWLIGGVGTLHIGASSIVFGWVIYLILRGFFAKNALHIGVGIVVLIVYGSILWGVFPTQSSVSWQGHLTGAIGGGIAAWVLRPKKPEGTSAAPRR